MIQIFAKLKEVILSQQTQEQILARILKNPKTSWAAAIVGSMAASAGWLLSHDFLIAGGLLAGLTAIVACIALLFAADGGGPNPPPGAA